MKSMYKSSRKEAASALLVMVMILLIVGWWKYYTWKECMSMFSVFTCIRTFF